MNLQDIRDIEYFCEMLTVERGAAQNTTSAYNRDLTKFAQFITKFNPDGLRAASTENLIAYFTNAKIHTQTVATQRRKISSLRQFYHFLTQEKILDHNPALILEIPKKTKTLPRIMSIAEVEKFIETAWAKTKQPAKNKTKTLRLICLVELLYATGMRASELVCLPAATCRGERNMIIIRGKGGKERLIALGEPARNALNNWLAIRDVNPKWSKSPYAFPSSKQNHLSRIRLYQLLQNLADEANIAREKCTPHALRHAFATHLLANGAQIRAIQQLLGHADIATTEIYTHLADEQLCHLVHKAHPLMRPTSPQSTD